MEQQKCDEMNIHAPCTNTRPGYAETWQTILRHVETTPANTAVNKSPSPESHTEADPHIIIIGELTM